MILIHIYISLLLSVIILWLSAAPRSVDSQMEMTDIKVLERGDDWQCASIEERERARNEINIISNQVIANVTGCNGTSGWKRVAFINMTDTSYNCPTGLSFTSYSKRTCGRSHTTAGCSSTTFSVGGLPYSQVCGRIRGYQFGATSGFLNRNNQGIDGYYIEGLSLTHGTSGRRQHIWTFAAGLSEVTASYPNEGCPCDTAALSVVPAFVGNDYFCESGLHVEWTNSYHTVFHANDVLWDGQNCTSTSTCCQLNNPPWFIKNLPTATTDDIELRICVEYSPLPEDVPVELIELYVK